MLIYLLVIIFITLIGLFIDFEKTNKKKKIFLYISYIPITLLAMLRDKTIGIDTMQYVINYKKISLVSLSRFNTIRYEYGFTLFCKILSTINNNPQFLLIISSLLVNYCMAKFIYKNSKSVVFSTMIYIFLNFYFNNMNIMRQAIAMSIILLGYEYLKEKKYFIYSLYVAIASSFHFTAIISLVFILIREYKFNKRFLYVVLLIAIILFFYSDNIFLFMCKISPRLMDYLESGKNTEANFYGGLILSVMYLLIFMFGMVIIRINSKSIFYDKNNNNNTLIGLISCAFLFSILGMKVSILNRFVQYFSMFIIIWIPNTICLIKKAKNRMITIAAIYCLLISFWVIIMIYRPIWYGVIPYRFWGRC